MDNWKWYVAHIQGAQDVAFEADMSQLENDWVPCRKFTHLKYAQTREGMVMGPQKWGPLLFRSADEVGKLRYSAIILLSEPIDDFKAKLESHWSKLASNGGIVAGKAEDLKKLG